MSTMKVHAPVMSEIHLDLYTQRQIAMQFIASQLLGYDSSDRGRTSLPYIDKKQNKVLVDTYGLSGDVTLELGTPDELNHLVEAIKAIDMFDPSKGAMRAAKPKS